MSEFPTEGVPPKNIVLEINTQLVNDEGGSKYTTSECACCCEPFTKKTRAPVHCSNTQCKFIACKECVRRYLLSSTESPHCMDCKTAWNQRFLVSNLNASFVNKEYTKHRKQLLVEKQISLMPQTMPALEQHQKRIELDKFERATKAKIAQLKAEIDKYHQDIYNAHREFNAGEFQTKENKKKFILPCPDENCRGWLSTAYKCEVCQYYACPKCLELTGKERTDDSHVCDQQLVETAKFIRQSTKPCPKCGERIMKSQGCDQMWCISCHTAFSWKTGEIQTGVIHNPHFFEYQRNVNQGGAVRNPGDMVCGGLPNDWWRMRNYLRQILTGSHLRTHDVQCACSHHVRDKYESDDNLQPEKNVCERQYHSDLINKYSELFQFLRHVNGHELPRNRQQVVSLDDNEGLRVQYLLKNITKEELGNDVMKRDKRKRKLIEMMHLYELIAAVGNDLINHIHTFVYNNLKTEDNYFVICREMTEDRKSVV